ncbi:MAG: ornithine cyclodeaminase family protein [Thermofilaceae archaeon]
MNLKFLYLRQEEVVKAGVLDFEAALKDIEEVLRMLARGEVEMPPKAGLEFFFPDGSQKGHILAMPAYLRKLGIAGVKWAAGFFKNPELYSLPHGIDVVILSDPESGRPLAIMDGTLITAVRTGSVAAVGAKYLSAGEVEVASIIGAGVVGRAAAHAFEKALPQLEEIRLFDLKADKAQLVAQETTKAKVVHSLEEAVKGSDVVVTATSSHNHFVKLSALKRDCVCVEVGKNEFEEAVILNASRIVVDYWEQLKSREWVTLSRLVKQGLVSEDRIEEIADIVDDSSEAKCSGIRFFSPIGMACEDIIVAHRLYHEALRKGIGAWLELWKEPLWS